MSSLLFTSTPPISRPFVTLTFAQSIDAKIAGKNGTQVILSGNESMHMTHSLRSMHDAILIGIGTALNDNPQLNTRLLPLPHLNIPRPVILDSHLRLSPSCKLLVNYNSGNGRRPWVICSPPLSHDPAWSTRLHALQHAGAHVIQITTSSSSYLPIPTVLSTLHQLGIKSLMVEGGAQIISSFFADPVVDTLIVTIAPTFVGVDGISYNLSSPSFPGFRHISSELFGKDLVVSMVPS